MKAMDLIEVFIVTLTRYNFSEPFSSAYNEYDHYPTKEECGNFTKRLEVVYFGYANGLLKKMNGLHIG